jgi:hypothetical protein
VGSGGAIVCPTNGTGAVTVAGTVSWSYPPTFPFQSTRSVNALTGSPLLAMSPSRVGLWAGVPRSVVIYSPDNDAGANASDSFDNTPWVVQTPSPLPGATAAGGSNQNTSGGGGGSSSSSYRSRTGAAYVLESGITLNLVLSSAAPRSLTATCWKN